MPQRAKYLAISETLIADIRSGTLRPGDKLPTERQLSDRFQVHRMTVRQATDLLTRRGLVEKRLPLGIFVRKIERSRIGLKLLHLVCSTANSSLNALFEECGVVHARRVGLQPRIMRIGPGDEHLAAAAIVSGDPSILFGLETPQQGEICQAMRRANGRAVALAVRLDHLGIPSVLGDDHVGIRMAVEHLTGLGHRRIALLCSLATRTNTVMEVQVQFFREAMYNLVGEDAVLRDAPDAGIIRLRQPRIGGTLVGSYQQMRRFLALPELRPTAILGLDESVTDGAAAACHHVGLRVPEDISLVAYAGTYHSAMAVPPRTSVVVSMKDHLAEALQMIGLAERGRLPLDRRLRIIRPHLIVRASTAVPKA